MCIVTLLGHGDPQISVKEGSVFLLEEDTREGIFFTHFIKQRTFLSLVTHLFGGWVVAFGNCTFSQKDTKFTAPSSLFCLKGA